MQASPIEAANRCGMRLAGIAIVLAILAALSPAALAESEDPRSISQGCSGGFTGGGGGVTVRSDGAILRWSRATYRDSVEESLIRWDTSATRRLFAEVDDSAFTSIRYSKFGNMTCQVILRRGTSSHAVSWEMGDPSAPSLATEIAARLERLARPVESE